MAPPPENSIKKSSTAFTLGMFAIMSCMAMMLTAVTVDAIPVPVQAVLDEEGGAHARVLHQYHHNKSNNTKNRKLLRSGAVPEPVAQAVASPAFDLTSGLDPKTVVVKVTEAALWTADDANAPPESQPTRSGVIVLGMHRSGTSMLTGLLHQGMGYDLGTAPMYGPVRGENFKGFFERIDIVTQNDVFLQRQGASWHSGIEEYKSVNGNGAPHQAALTNKGQIGLEFMNRSPTDMETADTNNNPWIQKDPRMSITLRDWVPFFNQAPLPPAILFTYRHPLEVAYSLVRREHNRDGKPYTLVDGLQLWYIYNRRAIENSSDLCVVRTSSARVLASPQTEVQRISDELTHKCQVVPPPTREMSLNFANDFVDPSLQQQQGHDGSTTTGTGSRCTIPTYQKLVHVQERERLMEVQVLESETDSGIYIAQEQDMYLKAMTLFCDIESDAAFEPNYF
jgi:hypothetical protein